MNFFYFKRADKRLNFSFVNIRFAYFFPHLSADLIEED